MKYFYGRMEATHFQNEIKLYPFALNTPFLYVLKTLENLTVF